MTIPTALGHCSERLISFLEKTDSAATTRESEGVVLRYLLV